MSMNHWYCSKDWLTRVQEVHKARSSQGPCAQPFLCQIHWGPMNKVKNKVFWRSRIEFKFVFVRSEDLRQLAVGTSYQQESSDPSCLAQSCKAWARIVN